LEIKQLNLENNREQNKFLIFFYENFPTGAVQVLKKYSATPARDRRGHAYQPLRQFVLMRAGVHFIGQCWNT
jgi:hypothetical protein